jgi:hypothetical protein
MSGCLLYLPSCSAPAAARAVEQTHQILKSIVTQAINEVTELQRFVNLKSEILAHAAVTLDRLKESSEATGERRLGRPAAAKEGLSMPSSARKK